MSSNIPKIYRCAVYCRKSHEEGLEQDYNSLDAQRDAGLAYIASQRHEGWQPILKDYADGGFSGGNMERPALKQLMDDIDAGLIDIVVVYKIDRLTRNLSDFSKMVEVFDQRRVTFVSVTQQFNTTTSMGRLTLNILLSFAQFEREVTGERIRDKIAASKRKGMWMGGMPPLGYDVDNRKLIINPDEAETVTRIFKRFIELGSSTLVVKELRLSGLTSKTWMTQEGHQRQGVPIDKSLIYRVLNNRTYLGEIRHKDNWYPGGHDAIIDADTWQTVHTILAQSSRSRGNKTKTIIPFLLKGILFGYDGRALSPTHTRKKGKQYRYYVSQLDQKQQAGTSGLSRLPAAELEATVLDHLRQILRGPQFVPGVITQAIALDPTLDEAKVAVAMLRLDLIWEQLFPAEQDRLVRLLLDRVIVTPHTINVQFRPNGLQQLTHELNLTEAEECSA